MVVASLTVSTCSFTRTVVAVPCLLSFQLQILSCLAGLVPLCADGHTHFHYNKSPQLPTVGATVFFYFFIFSKIFQIANLKKKIKEDPNSIS